jgi:hypothetical protein
MNTQPDTQRDSDDLEWLREIRRKLTTSFDHDQKKIGDYLREREKAMGNRIVRTQSRLVPAQS